MRRIKAFWKIVQQQEKQDWKLLKRCLASKISDLLLSNIKAQIQENSMFSKKK